MAQRIRKRKCRKASKAAAQARWLAKKENANYFRGPENVCRVQEWHKHNPGYWQRKGAGAGNTLQDHSNGKIAGKQYVAKQLAQDALQDFLMTQHAVLVGLTAHLIDEMISNCFFGNWPGGRKSKLRSHLDR